MSQRRAHPRKRSNGASPLLAGTGALTLLLAVVLLYVAFKAPTGIPAKPYYDVTAQFKSLGTLSQGASVSIAGNVVGEAVNLRRVGGVPTVDLQLNSSTPRLPVDTTARIRPRGLLGAEYVDLVPGHAKQTVPDGGAISAAQTSTAAQLSDVLSTFDAPTRTGFGELLRGLGAGVAGRGPQLNEMLATAPATLQHLVTGLDPLLARQGATARLIGGTDSLTAALDPVRGDIAAGFGKGADALRPFAQESGSVARLLAVAPAALRQIQASLNTTDPVLGHLTAFARSAAGFTALAPQALRSLTNVLVRGRAPLRDANALLRQTQPAIAPTLGLTSALNPELPHLNSLFNVLVAPVVTLGRYGCDIAGFAHNWRGFLGQGTVLQSGPLGPYTMLRTELSGPGVALPNLTLPTSGGQTDNLAPCVSVPGGS